MKRGCCSVLFALILIFPMLAAAKHEHDDRGLADTTVLIIRHAEKPDDGAGLTAEGEARAQAYANYFENLTLGGAPVRPDSLFAAADSKQSMRPRLTLEPISHALGLSIDLRFSDKRSMDLAQALRTESHGHVVWICWHHAEIPALIRALGADSASLIPEDKWPSKVFGWVVVLHYDHKGQWIPSTSRVIPEHLMPDDQ